MVGGRNNVMVGVLATVWKRSLGGLLLGRSNEISITKLPGATRMPKKFGGLVQTDKNRYLKKLH